MRLTILIPGLPPMPLLQESIGCSMLASLTSMTRPSQSPPSPIGSNVPPHITDLFFESVTELFHDNTPLKAQDVKTTYDFILNPKHASPHRANLSLIKRIETPTDDTVDFFLHKPDALFPSYLVIGIVPGNLIRKNHAFPEHPIGSGPFSFVQWLDDTRLQLRRQRDGQLFEFIRIPNPTVRTLKLLAGEIEMMQNDLPPELVAYLADNPKVRVQRERGANFSYLGFNMEDPIVGQDKVRKAIFHAIDRESIIRFVLGGGAAPANALFPPQHWVGHPSLSGI